MARMIYGDSYGDVANRELATDSARDQRYFQSLASNRAAQAQRQQQAQAEANNQLSWQQLLHNAAIQAANRNDDLSQRDWSNRFRQAEFERGNADRDAQLGLERNRFDLARRTTDFNLSPERQEQARMDDLLGQLDGGGLGDVTPEEAVTALGVRPDSLTGRLALMKQREHLATVAEQDRGRETLAAMVNSSLADNQRQRMDAAVVAAQAAVPGPNTTLKWWGRQQDQVDAEKEWAKVAAERNPPPPLARDDRFKIIANISKNPEAMEGLIYDGDGPVQPRLRLPVGRRPLVNAPATISPQGDELFNPLTGTWQPYSSHSSVEPAETYNPATGTWQPAGTSPKVAPQAAPTNPAMLKRGVIYQTPRGPLRWTGTGFVAP